MIQIEKASCREPEITQFYHNNSLNKVFSSGIVQFDSLKELRCFVHDRPEHMKEIHILGPKIDVTIKVVMDIKKAGKESRKEELSSSEIETITTFCGPSLLNFTVFPAEERQPLVVVGDIERLSKQKGALHMDFTFMTSKYSFLCLSERVEYAFTKKGGLVEGKSGLFLQS